MDKSIELNIGLVIPRRDGQLSFWARHKEQLEDSINLVELGKFEGIDIDEETDWEYAEEIFKTRLNQTQN